MTVLTRWDPFREFTTLQERMNRLVRDQYRAEGGSEESLTTTNFAPPVDVYEDEPKLAPGLAQLENVTIPPHIASASIDTRSKMATMAASNIIAFFKGEKPPNVVNPEVLS